MRKLSKILILAIFSLLTLVFIAVKFGPVRTGPEYDLKTSQKTQLNEVKSIAEGMNAIFPQVKSLETLLKTAPYDIWGTTFRFMPLNDRYILTTAGPDKIFNNDDDLSVEVIFKP